MNRIPKTHPNISIIRLAIPRNRRLKRSIRLRGPRPRNNKLRALGIELRRIRLMQRNQLVPNQIIPRRQARGDLARPLLVPAHQLGNIPPRRPLGVEEDLDAVAVEAGVVDLEPACAGAVARGEGARALVHPDEDGALGVGPLAPCGGDGVAGGGGGGEGGRGAAVAAHFGVGGVGDGVVVVPLALDYVFGVARGEALVSDHLC